MHILCVLYLYFWGENPQKGAYPSTYQFQLLHIHLFGKYKSIIRDAVLVILLVMPRS